jgi:hypothetical protein
VAPGTVIVVSPNAWIDTQKQFANITVITAFVTSIVAFLTVVINFVRIFVP